MREKSRVCVVNREGIKSLKFEGLIQHEFGKKFLSHDKWTAAVLNINSASKLLEKNAFFIIKMASESHFKTIQQLTCFVMKIHVKCIFFTSDFVLTSVSRVLFMPASENNLKLKNIFPSFFSKYRKGIVFSTFWSQKSISEKLFSKDDKWTAAVLNMNSASKFWKKMGKIKKNYSSVTLIVLPITLKLKQL
jgi:hypothetical protein